MTGQDLITLVKKNSEIVICGYCKQEYGIIPETEGIPRNIQKLTTKNNHIDFHYYRDGIHCVPCGLCNTFVQKEELYHPLADSPICANCRESFRDSCYTFEEDLYPV